MMNEKSPAILADLWREEFEKYLISMLPDIEAKAVLTDLYTVLNFLSKVAKELEYKKKDNIFDLFFERDLDLTCTLYGLAAEAIEEEFIEKLNNYAGNRFTQDQDIVDAALLYTNQVLYHIEDKANLFQANIYLDAIRKEAPFIVYFILFFSGQTRIIEQIINQSHERSLKIFLNSLKIWESSNGQLDEQQLREMIENRSTLAGECQNDEFLNIMMSIFIGDLQINENIKNLLLSTGFEIEVLVWAQLKARSMKSDRKNMAMHRSFSSPASTNRNRNSTLPPVIEEDNIFEQFFQDDNPISQFKERFLYCNFT